MPFVPDDNRVDMAHGGPPISRGDHCYLEYRELMDSWRLSSRWTTIDQFAERIWPDPKVRAAGLALLVFMHKHGFGYEDAQCAKNGDIL